MVIGINCGHTVDGPGMGAVGIIRESEHTRLVGDSLMKMLTDAGASVVNCTVDRATSQEAYLEKRFKQPISHLWTCLSVFTLTRRKNIGLREPKFIHTKGKSIPPRLRFVPGLKNWDLLIAGLRMGADSM